ncbi:SDR family NAD(P)-dependent oxidoreductase [Arthrobacter sp. SIMBA_036]|uniref:SDR family NAD(P)-dependent oxidoreductase n=1 Tax=Arthrobacter sp. SIMBA_036 TaxID=3085778 RepID=UPI003978D704
MTSDRILAGKHVLITGAGRGLGEAYARAAAAEGARVVVSDINAESAEAVAESINREGGEALAVAADVTDWDSCQRLVAAAVERFGKLDGLVNNAGYLETVTAGQETQEHIRRHVDINVCGTYFMSVHGLAAMEGRGSIVNVTSGAVAGLRMMSAYAAAKAAIASLTFAWATEFDGKGVRVNAMAPHADTPMMTAGTEAYTKFFGGSPVAPPPSTNAPVVLYLLSDLSEGVNGQVVRLANGRDLMLLSHPGILDAPLTRESWTPRDVNAAFDDVLRAKMQPSGQLIYTDSHSPSPDLIEFAGANQ